MRKLSIPTIGPGWQLAVIAAIFFLSFLTFNILFRATGNDGYFQEIIAALIGTILAAVVTAMLLSSQTRGEELKERNVEVFRKKVEVYERFLDQAIDHLEDWKLSDEEARLLRRSIYRLSLFSSEDTIITVTNFLRAQFVQDSDCNIGEVISAFRNDLALENLDDLASWDMEAVDSLLQTADRASLELVQAELERFSDSLFRILLSEETAALLEGMEADEVSGLGNGVSFDLSCPSGLSYGLSMEYAVEPAGTRFVEGYLDSSELPAAMRANVLQLALAQGFEADEDDETSVDESLPELLIDPNPDASSGRRFEDRRIWTIGEFAQAILALERAVASDLGSSKSRKPAL